MNERFVGTQKCFIFYISSWYSEAGNAQMFQLENLPQLHIGLRQP